MLQILERLQHDIANDLVVLPCFFAGKTVYNKGGGVNVVK